MRGKKLKIFSLIFGCGVALSLLIFNMFAIIKISSNDSGKSSKNTIPLYDNVYYASAEEDTGASTASSSFYKGGSVYLAKNSNYTLKSGSIEASSNRYGGAFYVSNGAVLTIEGGVIENCSASYGGAIYVEAGGKVVFTGGIIRKNSAKVGPAIYVEAGGTIIDDGATIINNFYSIGNYRISQDTIVVGNPSAGLNMHYLEFGTYPQTYVGNTMNATLESWYQASSPTIREEYVTSASGSYGQFKGYLYTDGNMYARGISRIYSAEEYEAKDCPSDMKYMSGENLVPTGSVVWFKVEPIQWLVLNYEEVMAETAEEINVLSYMGLASSMKYYPNNTDENRDEWCNSSLRSWLNTTFFNSAFNAIEQKSINLKTIQNNVTGNYNSSSSDGSGTATQDWLWFLSYYEMTNTYFTTSPQRLCSPTDFTMSNYCYKRTDTAYVTATHPNGGTCCYWTRSAGSSGVFDVRTSGGVLNLYVINEDRVVRPAMSLSI